MRLPQRPRRQDQVPSWRSSATHCALRPAQAPAPPGRAAPQLRVAPPADGGDMPLLSMPRIPWSDGRVRSTADQIPRQQGRRGTHLHGRDVRTPVRSARGVTGPDRAAGSRPRYPLERTRPGRVGGTWSGPALAVAQQVRPGCVRCPIRGRNACTRPARAHPRGYRRPPRARSHSRLPERRRTLAQRAPPARKDRRAGPAHLPDGEVHWPDSAAVAWAGECWAIEAERTAKTVVRTTAIMRELLTRTGDYGCPAADARVPGAPPRHARVIYLCAPAALGTVTRARGALGRLAVRIEIRNLPASAQVPP